MVTQRLEGDKVKVLTYSNIDLSSIVVKANIIISRPLQDRDRVTKLTLRILLRRII
jgi:hypothetical protein